MRKFFYLLFGIFGWFRYVPPSSGELERALDKTLKSIALKNRDNDLPLNQLKEFSSICFYYRHIRGISSSQPIPETALQNLLNRYQMFKEFHKNHD